MRLRVSEADLAALPSEVAAELTRLAAAYEAGRMTDSEYLNARASVFMFSDDLAMLSESDDA